jgi:hypothetical protein
MKATQLEYRHQLLFHLLVVGVAWLTYVVDPVDVVWALVEHRPNAKALERLCFALATLLIGAGVALRTWDGVKNSNSRAGHPHIARHLGSFLFSIGLGSLVPMPGFLILVFGEGILVTRLILRERSDSVEPSHHCAARHALPDVFRSESAKWGIFVAMIVFTLVLVDRVADILVGASIVLWILLNCGPLRSRRGGELAS